MQLTLENFEKNIEVKILERGFQYFKNGYVSRLEKVGENEFSALVLGNDDYNVFVKLDDKTIVEYECDCPFDWGDACKHAVAVFYSLKTGSNVGNEIQTEIERILNSFSEKELKKYFADLLKKDWQFRNRVLQDFESDLADYKDEIY